MKIYKTPIGEEQLALLTQYEISLSKLSGYLPAQRERAEEIYQSVESLMISTAPSEFQKIYTRIVLIHLRIVDEHVETIMDSIPERDGLSPDEEQLYRKAIEDENHFPSSYP